MISTPSQYHGYRPGWIAKLSVIVAAALYFIGLYLDGMRGADLGQGAFLQLLVPFILVVPAIVIGHLAYSLTRRRQRAGDIGFSLAILAECITLVAVALAR